MKPLTERMTKANAPKTWIKEVEAKDREIESLEQTKDQYLNIIDLLAREKEGLEEENKKVVNAAESGIAKAWKRVEELQAETEALSELLSPLVDVELERDALKRGLEYIAGGGAFPRAHAQEVLDALLTAEELLPVHCAKCGKRIDGCECYGGFFLREEEQSDD